MLDKRNIHLGPIVGCEVTKEGPSIITEIHMADGFSDAEIIDAISENHGIDPAKFNIRREEYRDSKGRRSYGFAGAWASSASKWEPTGTTPNYGYKPNMN